MIKLFTLVLIFLLTIFSFSIYFYTHKKIIAGEQQLAAGEIQLEQGQRQLTSGKKRLSSGKQTLSKAKSTFKYLSLVGAVVAPPVAGLVYVGANKKFAEKNKLVASGEAKVRRGEKQIEQGVVRLSRGYVQLSLAKKIRLVSALATGFFVVLFIVLGIYWGRNARR